uniref:Mating-type protein MAT1-1-1 n=2 Tax=Ophiostoma TaxID=5159 RepID=W8P9C9_OPHUL|nr:mating-type protein MAT1-1-1 [Ophiostoma ulmi]AHL24880.1 mating-type protein MAT1-1-1 [Ophiostoma novo-ulmi subsp. americana]
MAPSTAATPGTPDKQGKNPQMLPNMQQKDRSGVLTSLWGINPHKNQWTMMAKVYSFLRAELGKDAVLLPSFLEHSCAVLRIPSLDTYLQQQGFALLENETGSLSLVNQAKPTPSNPLSSIQDLSEDCGSHASVSFEDTSAFTEAPGFLNFKNNNQESIDAAVAAFQGIGQQETSLDVMSDNEEAAAGLYAEHELLQAVFDRGLELDPKTLKEGETAEKQKQCLVQKLCSMAYEMLIGGEFPVIVGTKGFSHTIKHNPIAAVSHLFSRENKLDFDVLVVDKEDRVKNHVFCQVNPEGSDKAVILSTTGQQTVNAQTIVGPFHTGTPQQPHKNRSHDPDMAENSTPTYTQKMAYQSPQNGGRFHIFTSQPSTLGNSIITNTNSNIGEASSPSGFNSNAVATGKHDSPESYASFEGSASASASASASCSTSPPVDHAWSQSHDDYKNEDGTENNLIDINYAQGGASGRRFSLSCASDAETIVITYQPQPQPKTGVSWFGSQFSNSASSTAVLGTHGAHFHQQTQQQQAPFLTTSHSMPVLPATSNAVQHTRKRTHDAIEYVPSANQASKRGRGRDSGHLSQDAGFLLQTLVQNPAEVQAQLSQGQRPPVFDQIYRAQMAHSLSLSTAAFDPLPRTTVAPGAPSEDPMMPSMHSLHSMHPMEQMQATVAAQTTSSLLNYNFPQSMPNMHAIHATQQHSNLASVFSSMQNPADGAALDLSDPAMLDRFLGIASESTETADSSFGWPC